MPDNPTPELLAALSKFQRSTITAFKDATGYGYKYATETSINKALVPAKADGLLHAFTCKPLASAEADVPGQTEVTLRVFHAASGGYLASSMLVQDFDPANKKDARHQQRGSGITYARRYLLTAMFGLACDENEGETTLPPAEASASKPVPTPPASTPKQEPDFSKHRKAFGEKIKAIFATDPGVYAQWSAELIAEFKGSPSPISTAKPTPENLTCAAHFVFCDEFLARYKLASANGKS